MRNPPGHWQTWFFEARFPWTRTPPTGFILRPSFFCGWGEEESSNTLPMFFVYSCGWMDGLEFVGGSAKRNSFLKFVCLTTYHRPRNNKHVPPKKVAISKLEKEIIFQYHFFYKGLFEGILVFTHPSHTRPYIFSDKRGWYGKFPQLPHGKTRLVRPYADPSLGPVLHVGCGDAPVPEHLHRAGWGRFGWGGISEVPGWPARWRVCVCVCVKTPSNTVSILPNSHIELFKQGAGAGGGGLRPTKTPPPPGVNVPASFFFRTWQEAKPRTSFRKRICTWLWGAEFGTFTLRN